MQIPDSFSCDVSIVIVSFNTRDLLRECLLAVFRTVGSLRIQVIVVDNARSEEHTSELQSLLPLL
jgi:GT2 family glycosyltransferase